MAGVVMASTGRRASPNDRVGIGLIGCGGMGRMNLTDFQKNPEVDVVALCDVYQPNLKKAVAAVPGKPQTHGDYRKLLEQGDVDAVIVATPDHWHALPTVEGCDAGKDVYVEKPVSHCIREGRLMVEAARRNHRVVQVGLQQRSGTHFQRAVNMVQQGELGKIHYVQCWNHEWSPPEGMGNPPDGDPPPGLDWDAWLGPAPKVPFNKNRFGGTFRWFYDYGGGKLADWGSHLIDVVHWAMRVEGPVSAAASGGKFHLTDNRDTPDTIHVVYEYPGFLMQYSSLSHNTYGHNGQNGAKPFGSGYEVIPQMTPNFEPVVGSLLRDVDDLTGTSIYYTSLLAEARGTTSLQHLPHVRNFLDCVKTRKRPNADIADGHLATAACHLGNIAYRTGKKLHWDPKAERITNDEKANEMVTRRYRLPWKLAGL